MGTHAVFPSCTLTVPCSSPKVRSTGRSWSNLRPSSRTFLCSASRTNARSLTEISASLPIVSSCLVDLLELSQLQLCNFLPALTCLVIFYFDKERIGGQHVTGVVFYYYKWQRMDRGVYGLE